jgi:hypothetical protein
MRTRLALVATALLLIVPLAGCIGDTGQDTASTDAETPTGEETPVSPLPDEIQGLAELSTVETEGSGTGIWIDEQRDVLISANGGAGMQLYDVSDAGNATQLGSLGNLSARDADLLRWNETPYAILAGGGEGIHVVDITDPRSPELVVTADEYSSHNVAVVPGTPYVYDSTAVGAQNKVTDPVIPVLDLTDPGNPAWVTIEIPAQVNGQATQSDGCHDVVVRQDLGKAFCAGGGSMYRMGGGETFIWDISEDPTSPVWEGIVDNPSIVYHHQALASQDGKLLFINDEHIESNCNGVSQGPVDARQTTAAMWVYDISDPADPTMRSYVQVNDDEVNDNCGSHFGSLVGDRPFLAWGWYEAGTLLIDVSDPDNARIADRIGPAGSTWDAKYHEGHVYGSSGNLQVLDIVGGDDA